MEEDLPAPRRRSLPDLDETQTIPLDTRGSHKIVYERETFQAYILQSCPLQEWTKVRRKLYSEVEEDFFISPRFFFFRKNRIYVGSDNIAGISLADVIGCTRTMNKSHASAVLKQVILGLQSLAKKNIMYNSVKASHIFLSSRDGKVRLLGFGPEVRPQALKDKDGPNPDCQDVGHLAHHILTRIEKITAVPQTPEQKMVIKTKCGKYAVNIDHPFDAEFFDFLDACMDPDSTMERLLKNKFLENCNPACLKSVVENAERYATRTDL